MHKIACVCICNLAHNCAVGYEISVCWIGAWKHKRWNNWPSTLLTLVAMFVKYSSHDSAFTMSTFVRHLESVFWPGTQFRMLMFLRAVKTIFQTFVLYLEPWSSGLSNLRLMLEVWSWHWLQARHLTLDFEFSICKTGIKTLTFPSGKSEDFSR